MRIPRFTSEFPLGDQPQFHGTRMTHTTLAASVSTMSGSDLTQASQQNIIHNAVSGFYYAKYFINHTLELDLGQNTSLKTILKELSEMLLKQAIISIASSFDGSARPETPGPPKGRTKSLNDTLEHLVAILQRSGPAEQATLDSLQAIRESIKPDQPAIRYVSHLRNKWAGHASLDMRFDKWAEADEVIRLEWVEAALTQIVNAYADYADLIRSTPELTRVTTAPEPAPQYDQNGLAFGTFTVDWSSTTTLALMARTAARNNSDHLFSILTEGIIADSQRLQ